MEFLKITSDHEETILLKVDEIRIKDGLFLSGASGESNVEVQLCEKGEPTSTKIIPFFQKLSLNTARELTMQNLVTSYMLVHDISYLYSIVTVKSGNYVYSEASVLEKYSLENECVVSDVIDGVSSFNTSIFKTFFIENYSDNYSGVKLHFLLGVDNKEVPMSLNQQTKEEHLEVREDFDQHILTLSIDFKTIAEKEHFEETLKTNVTSKYK